MKTAIHEGKEYQIGALYEFSDNGVEWFISRLASIDKGFLYIFSIDEGSYKYIREIQNPVIGTIKDAPVELINGHAYQFNYLGLNHGFYSASEDEFVCLLCTIEPRRCTNIVKLVPEVK